MKKNYHGNQSRFEVKQLINKKKIIHQIQVHHYHPYLTLLNLSLRYIRLYAEFKRNKVALHF